MNTKSKKIILIAVIVMLGLLLGILLLAQQKKDQEETIENAGRILSADPERFVLIRDGKSYPIRKHLESILLIGTDESDERYNTDPDEEYYYNYGMADFQMLLVFDNDKRSVVPVQINRDTITEVPWTAVNGGIGGYELTQIAYSFSNGSGGTDSCEIAADTVSRFLYCAPVDGYLQFTMDAVPIVNDLIGGVTVTVPSDIPELGSDYIKGAIIKLDGESALRFIRYRDISRLESNADRMDRQRLYMSAFIPTATSAYNKNEELVPKALEQLKPYLQTKMTANEISAMVNRLSTYDIQPVCTYSGHYELGQYAEFYPDENSLWNCVLSAFG